MTMLGMLGSTKGKPAKGAGLSLDLFQESFRANGKTPTFSEVVTHSRSGNATMVDSDGLLKWAPHNLLSYSEQFDNAYWGNSGTANTAIAPDGTTTADTVTLNDSSILGVSAITNIGSGATFTGSVWVNGTAGETYVIGLNSNKSGVGWTSTDSNTFAYAGTVIYRTFVLSGGWERLTITASLNSAIVSGVGVAFYAGESRSRGTGTDPITALIWGAHLYRSGLGGMVDNPDQPTGFESYVPTTSSAVYLPRRGHHVYNGSAWVNEGLLHESEARSNLISASVPSNVDWTLSQATITADAGTAPDGTSEAAKLTENTATSNHYVQFVNITISSGAVTGSVFLKAGERSWARLRLSATTSSVRAWFDLANGTVGTVDSGATAQIEDFGNGWYRCSLTEAGNTASTSSGAFQVFSQTANFETTYTGDGTSGIYIWGAQLEAGPTPSSYIPTAGATVTRAAETLTIPSANLPWPTPQVIGDELVTNGTFDTDTSGWSVNGGAIASVGGVLRVTDTSSEITRAISSISTEVGKVYLASADLIAENASPFFKTTNNSDGTSNNGGQVFPMSLGSNSFIFVASATTTYVVAGNSIAESSQNDFDNISVREINPLSVSIQMDGRLGYADEGSAGQVTYAKWEADANNRIALTLDTDSTATGEVNFTQVEAGTADTVVSSATEYAPGILVPFNIASRHGSTFINGAVDGVALTANTTPTALPDLSSTDLELGYDYMGTIKTFRIWDKDLGDTGIEEATEGEPSSYLLWDSSTDSYVQRIAQ